VVRRGGQGRRSVENSAIDVLRGDQLRWSGEEEVRRGGRERRSREGSGEILEIDVIKKVRDGVRKGLEKKRSGEKLGVEVMRDY
jgi:hypothetical protein